VEYGQQSSVTLLTCVLMSWFAIAVGQASSLSINTSLALASPVNPNWAMASGSSWDVGICH
jgi:hypothetical protein